MAYATSSGQVAEMAKCSRPSQTDVIFVAKNDLAEKVFVEDFIANRNATAKSYPCVFDLTFCFSQSFTSWLHPWLPNSQLTFHDIFEWQLTNSHKNSKSAKIDLQRSLF